MAKKKTVRSAKVSVCSQDKSFFVCDGSVYASLAELAKGLRKMNPDTYKYHANQEKNDFHNWIKDVFGNAKLAKQALTARDQKQLAKIVAAKLK
jgi:hypothetical protein